MDEKGGKQPSMADGGDLCSTQTVNTKPQRSHNKQGIYCLMAAGHKTAFAAPYPFPLGVLGFQTPLIILFCKRLTFTHARTHTHRHTKP